MRPIGVEWLCEVGLPPTDLVSLAADAECRHIGMTLEQTEYNPFNYPAWSLHNDSHLRRELMSRMADRGVSISLGEGCVIGPDIAAGAHKPALDLFCELGARRVNTVSFDPDRQRTFDEFCKLAEMTREVGLELTIEFTPLLTIRTLDETAELIVRIAQPHVKVLIDVMHFFRAGHTAADIARFDPAIFGYIQICDAPLLAGENYMDEAMNNRMIPGEGEMDVGGVIAALPNDLIVSMEIPFKRLADAGVPAAERIRRCATATRELLSAIER